MIFDPIGLAELLMDLVDNPTCMINALLGSSPRSDRTITNPSPSSRALESFCKSIEILRCSKSDAENEY